MNSQQVKQILNEKSDVFLKYYSLLVEWNEKMNLTAITDYADAEVKHFEDSLYGLPYVKQGATLCDVGTGAGFPGFPLKMARPDINLTLMDSLNKRIVFLNEVSKQTDTPANCVHIRAEDAGRGEYREKFDVVTARAVAKLNTLCEYCLPLVKKGGVFLAYKADVSEELEQSKNAVKILGGEIAEVNRFCLSNGDARAIVVIKKVSPTPKAYPRGKGKERSKPL